MCSLASFLARLRRVGVGETRVMAIEECPDDLRLLADELSLVGLRSSPIADPWNVLVSGCRAQYRGVQDT